MVENENQICSPKNENFEFFSKPNFSTVLISEMERKKLFDQNLPKESKYVKILDHSDGKDVQKLH